MIVKGLFRVVVLANIVFLAACSGFQQNVSSPVTSLDKGTAWEKRQEILIKQTSWDLGSKAALRYGDENVSFGLNWSQKPSGYIININNPLTGALVSRLTRSNNVITLLADDGKTYQDNDEERLLKNQTNLDIPLKGLQYWVRGLVSPDSGVNNLVLDNFGRPKSLEQEGWKVVYSSYFSNDLNALPRKIRLLRDEEEISIRLVAKTWK